ncbi:hypothetical protein [Natrinema gari]|uniref:Uncharacterized protein n=1 Tax=Natrinema gari JCM 14663 TaxID=1230459 RepID=L9ZF52_9EURY|nr:hypothetical protein [Natrinema gari]ELY85060.1 hypothetical protein C486_00340 [Natrinema gari JCM 14663]
MDSERVLVVGLVLILAISGALVTGVTASVAQDGDRGAETDSATTDGSKSDGNETQSVAMELDPNTRILDYRYYSENKTLEVDIETRGDTRERVILVERTEAGSESFVFEQRTIRGGETSTIVLEGVKDRGGDDAVLVASETGLENQDAEWIPTGEAWGPWAGEMATWAFARIAGLGGAIGATSFGVFYGWHRHADSSNKSEDAL